MNVSQAFPSKYLKATDIPAEGSKAVTIEKIALEEVGRDKETKVVVYFTELDRAMVLNKTNARTIGRLLGSEEFDDWVSRRIALYRADVEFAGEMMEGVRVRGVKAAPTIKPQPAKRPAPAPVSEDESEVDEDGIPF